MRQTNRGKKTGELPVKELSFEVKTLGGAPLCLVAGRRSEAAALFALAALVTLAALALRLALVALLRFGLGLAAARRRRANPTTAGDGSGSVDGVGRELIEDADFHI
jgi:hypothetical protein